MNLVNDIKSEIRPRFSYGIAFANYFLENKFKNKKFKTMTFVKRHPANINYLFDEILNGFPTNWGKDQLQNTFAPAANIHETNEGFHVELNVPGRNKEDFKVTIENGMLSIAFEQKEVTENNDYKTLRREFSFKSFKRSFSIDEKINAEAVQAKYENGILKLLLPKKEVIKIAPKEIEII